MSVGPTRGPVQRPDLDRDLTEIFQRLDDLERFKNPTASRVVYGAVDDDGTILDAGSEDWSVVWDFVQTYTFTVSPAFSAAILNVVATPKNFGSDDPRLLTVEDTLADASTFVVTTWNFIGDPLDSGFAFAAFEDPA